MNSRVALKKIVLAIALITISAASVGGERVGMEVSEFLNKIRKEIYEMKQKADSEKLPLYMNKMNVELNVAIEREVNGGVKIYVVEAGAKANNLIMQKLSFDVYLKQPKSGEWEQVKDEQSRDIPAAQYADIYKKAYDVAYRQAYIDVRRELQWSDMMLQPARQGPKALSPYQGWGWGWGYPPNYFGGFIPIIPKTESAHP